MGHNFSLCGGTFKSPPRLIGVALQDLGEGESLSWGGIGCVPKLGLSPLPPSLSLAPVFSIVVQFLCRGNDGSQRTCFRRERQAPA